MFVEYVYHLSEKEKSLKRELEVSVRRFFEFYEEFQQNKSKLELDVFDYFREIRFLIDEHREELKKRIDDISLEMINEAKRKSTKKRLRRISKMYLSVHRLTTQNHLKTL
jgi:hypothetical protein